MTRKTPLVELDDKQLGDTAGGQRSRVTSLRVTFDGQTTSGTGDPDSPVILGNAPNPGD